MSLSNHTLSLPIGAALISAPGASELPPAWVWGMPPSLSGPHSDLPSEVPPEKQRAVHMVPLPHPPPLRSRGGALQAFPPRAESQPSQAGLAVGGPGPAHSCPLGPKKRTQPHMLGDANYLKHIVRHMFIPVF